MPGENAYFGRFSGPWHLNVEVCRRYIQLLFAQHAFETTIHAKHDLYGRDECLQKLPFTHDGVFHTIEN